MGNRDASRIPIVVGNTDGAQARDPRWNEGMEQDANLGKGDIKPIMPVVPEPFPEENTLVIKETP